MKPHRCDDSCTCPVHGGPLIYWPAGGDHACRDIGCVYGNGMKGRWPPRGTRILAALAAAYPGGMTSRDLMPLIGERFQGESYELIPVGQALNRLMHRGLAAHAGHAPGYGHPYLWRLTAEGVEHVAKMGVAAGPGTAGPLDPQL